MNTAKKPKPKPLPKCPLCGAKTKAFTDINGNRWVGCWGDASHDLSTFDRQRDKAEALWRKLAARSTK